MLTGKVFFQSHGAAPVQFFASKPGYRRTEFSIVPDKDTPIEIRLLPQGQTKPVILRPDQKRKTDHPTIIKDWIK